MKKRTLYKRPPAPRFLARPRELYGTTLHVDEQDTIERIREATAMCDEPEQIGPAILSYAETNHKYNTLRRAQEVEDARELRKTLTLEQRVITARARAKQQRVDLSHQLHLVDKALERASKGGRRPAASVVCRMEQIEARLDGVESIERELERAA